MVDENEFTAMDMEDDDDEDDEVGCRFPETCCMPGLHYTDECHEAAFYVESLNDRGPIQELSEACSVNFPSEWQHPQMEKQHPLAGGDRWVWMMDWCKRNGLPPGNENAWTKAGWAADAAGVLDLPPNA